MQPYNAAMNKDVPIREQTIDLDQFLKLAAAVGSGGEVKYLCAGGLIRVNGEVETRRRRTLKIGDVVEIEGAPAMKVTAREA